MLKLMLRVSASLRPATSRSRATIRIDDLLKQSPQDRIIAALQSGDLGMLRRGDQESAGSSTPRAGR